MVISLAGFLGLAVIIGAPLRQPRLVVRHGGLHGSAGNHAGPAPCPESNENLLLSLKIRSRHSSRDTKALLADVKAGAPRDRA